MSEMSETIRRFPMSLPSGLTTDEVADELESLTAEGGRMRKTLEEIYNLPVASDRDTLLGYCGAVRNLANNAMMPVSGIQQKFVSLPCAVCGEPNTLDHHLQCPDPADSSQETDSDNQAPYCDHEYAQSKVDDHQICKWCGRMAATESAEKGHKRNG